MGKGALAPCPPYFTESLMVGTLCPPYMLDMRFSAYFPFQFGLRFSENAFGPST